MKRTLHVVITFCLGTLFVLEFFIPHHAVRFVVALFREWGMVLAAAAFILGAINIVQVNLPKIRRREKDWPYKVVLLASALVMLVLGLVEGKEGRTFIYLYEYVFAPCNATMFALLAFFIASAAFRAFRARNVEAMLMLGAAVVIMLTVVPIRVERERRPQAGLARAIGRVEAEVHLPEARAGERITPVGFAIGTPAFMAPEQTAGVAGPALDLFPGSAAPPGFRRSAAGRPESRVSS